MWIKDFLNEKLKEKIVNQKTCKEFKPSSLNFFSVNCVAMHSIFLEHPRCHPRRRRRRRCCPMGSDGLQWILMDSTGLQWMPIDSEWILNGFQRL